MTGDGEAFADFVRSRWGDLEPVAQLVVLDPVVAREVTTTALARLARDWGRALEEGRPVAEARRLVLAEAVDRARPVASGPAREDQVGGAPSGADPVRAALARHVRGLDPLGRALVATGHLWGADPHEVALLLERPSADVRAAGVRVRHGLEGAHDRARTAAGDEPAPWAFENEVRSAVDGLLGDLALGGPPPDPAELVGHRSRRLRRRTLLIGGAAAAGVAGVATAVGLRGGSPSSSVTPLPAATDRVWTTTSQWPVRGPLADDPGLRAFRAQRLRPADRILWVGDAGTRRVAVVWTIDVAEIGFGTAVRLFTGAAGSVLTGLDEVTPDWSHVEATDAVVAAVPDGPERSTARTVLIALGKPTDVRAEVSRLVRPTASGDLNRSWSDLPLREGIVVTVLAGAVVPSLRVRLGGFEGPPIGPTSPFEALGDIGVGEAVDRVEDFITSVTGIPGARLVTELVSDDPVPAGLFDDAARQGQGPGARVRRYLTRTPDGAVLRTALHVESFQLTANPLELAMLVPADQADAPAISWGADGSDGRIRFLVLHQPAATVQLVGHDVAVRSAAVPTRGARATVVEVPSSPEVGDFEVVLRDARGRELYRGAQVQGRWLLDG